MKDMKDEDIGDMTAVSISIVEKAFMYSETSWKELVTSDITL